MNAPGDPRRSRSVPCRTATPNPAGSFAPLRQPVFAVLWAATVLGNVGSFMRDVASSWLVTDLSASPTAVALIQTAATLPIFLLAIPAGVLSDILDRRRFLIFVQLLLASVSGTLLLLSHTGALTVDYLIALTFVGGIGAALMGPTWQSIVPELVPRADLKGAVALNSLGINIARAIGPAAGGLILASFGAAVTYGMDVLSYVFVIAALLWWKRPPPPTARCRRTSWARSAPACAIRGPARSCTACCCAPPCSSCSPAPCGPCCRWWRARCWADPRASTACCWARWARGDPGALLLPRLGKLDADGLVLLASVASAAVMAALVFAPPKWLAVLLLVVLGMGWITALTTFNSVAQAILPNWVRGRGLAVYLTVFNGAMAAGSLGWGLVAREIGVPYALAASAAGLVLVALLFHRVRLPVGEADLQASNHWPEPLVAEPVAHDRGPVLVQVEYRIRQADRPAFLAAMKRLSQERLRDGAYAWGVVEHTGDAERVVEWFFVESWAEHLRQHHRVSHADADL